MVSDEGRLCLVKHWIKGRVSVQLFLRPFYGLTKIRIVQPPAMQGDLDSVYTWRRPSSGLGPNFLHDEKNKVTGSVDQCVGRWSHRWLATVLPQGDMGPRLNCYARSKERGMYFVERWAACRKAKGADAGLNWTRR